MRRGRIPSGVRRWLAPLMAAVALGLLPGAAEAQLDQMLKGLTGGAAGAGLSDAKIGAGLKEALEVATEKTVSLTGKTDATSPTRRSRS